MRYFVSAMLVLVAMIHLLPLPGVIGAELLGKLYGVDIDDSNLELLLRHRAVLFGLLGLFLFYAAFQPAVQWLAFLAGFVSAASFLWLAWPVGNYNEAISRVFMADVIALIGLALGLAAYLFERRGA